MKERILYILDEEYQQEDYDCLVKYMFKSEFNHWANVYLQGKHYIYLSVSEGILLPNERIAPYEVKRLNTESMHIWSACTFQLIASYMKENKLTSICLLYSGNTYKGLEKILGRYFKVEKPIKHYLKNELKIKWIQNKIVEKISDKLTII